LDLKVGLLRSIAIGGRRVTGADARSLAEAVGGVGARSLLATGNLVFRSPKPPRVLETELEAACATRFGRATDMVVKTAEEWRALIAANPFPDEARRAPSHLLLFAFRTPLPDQGLEQLQRRASAEERMARTASGDLYIWFGEGNVSASRIPAGFGLKMLGAVGTNRNWNTATRILAALEEEERR
jgi:uncharacterized protein (DUF1697 family)